MKIRATRRSVRRAGFAGASAVTLAAVLAIVAPTAAQASGERYEKYPWSDTVYVSSYPYVAARAITYPEWVAAGSPTPRVGLVTGSHVISYQTNPSAIYIGPFQDDLRPRVNDRHVSYAEWLAVGSPSPTRSIYGYIKTANSPNIYRCSTDGGYGAPYLVTYDSWLWNGSPSPVTVSSITARCP
ncbi:hypothetical protein [Agromyces sp. NPDC056965]|uniref:hypothetical protein n=1 Tax=Agromyces sp. NPDC056965 TaxID=3345983 RepID=UPI003641C33F